MVGLTVIGDDVLAAKIRSDLGQIIAQKPMWLRDVGELVEQAIGENILRQGLEKTGKLFYSGRVFYQTKNGISVGYGKDLDYAWPLEFGARPHMIYAGGRSIGVNPNVEGSDRQTRWSLFIPGGGTGSSVLHFIDSAGEERFATAVHHPGNRPYRFVYRGAMEATYPVLLYFVRQLRVVFGGLPTT